MAKITTITIALVLIVAVALAASPPEAAQSPSPVANCFSYLSDAGDCLGFVESGSKLRKPDPKCCPELANLTANHPVCLCELLFNSSQYEISINTSQALKLPSLCNVTAPVSLCPALGVPFPSPPPAAKGPSGSSEDNGSPTTALLPFNHHFLLGLLLLYYYYTYILI